MTRAMPRGLEAILYDWEQAGQEAAMLFQQCELREGTPFSSERDKCPTGTTHSWFSDRELRYLTARHVDAVPSTHLLEVSKVKLLSTGEHS